MCERCDAVYKYLCECVQMGNVVRCSGTLDRIVRKTTYRGLGKPYVSSQINHGIYKSLSTWTDRSTGPCSLSSSPSGTPNHESPCRTTKMQCYATVLPRENKNFAASVRAMSTPSTHHHCILLFLVTGFFFGSSTFWKNPLTAAMGFPDWYGPCCGLPLGLGCPDDC